MHVRFNESCTSSINFVFKISKLFDWTCLKQFGLGIQRGRNSPITQKTDSRNLILDIEEECPTQVEKDIFQCPPHDVDDEQECDEISHEQLHDPEEHALRCRAWQSRYALR